MSLPHLPTAAVKVQCLKGILGSVERSSTSRSRGLRLFIPSLLNVEYRCCSFKTKVVSIASSLVQSVHPAADISIAEPKS